MDMSLSEAAKAVQKTKQTVLNAINSGRLSASKDHHGQWRIDSAELLRVYPVATIVAVQPGRDKTGHVDTFDGDVRELRARLAAAEEVKSLLARQVDDLRAERDRWRGQAEQLLLALPGALNQHGQPPVESGPVAEVQPVTTVDPGPTREASSGSYSDVSGVGQGLGHVAGEGAKKRGWLARLFGVEGGDDGQ